MAFYVERERRRNDRASKAQSRRESRQELGEARERYYAESPTDRALREGARRPALGRRSVRRGSATVSTTRRRGPVENDSAPPSYGPRGRPQGRGARAAAKTSQRGTAGVSRAFRGARTYATRTEPRRALMVELVAMLVLTGIAEVADTKAAPSPGAFVPAVVVFFVLGLVSDLSPSGARVATALGLVILMTTALVHWRGIVEALQAVAGVTAGSTPNGGTNAPTN